MTNLSTGKSAAVDKNAHITFQKKLRRQNLAPATKGAAVRYLLANEHIIDQPDEDGDTPLSNASDAGCLESVKILLARGAIVNATADCGFTALHRACYYKDQDSTEIAKLLIGAGADVNACTLMGQKPLCIATHSGNMELKLLLERLTLGSTALFAGH